MKLLVVGAIVLGAIGVFVWVGVVEGSIPRFQVHQFLQMPYSEECWIDDGKAEGQTLDGGGELSVSFAQLAGTLNDFVFDAGLLLA